MKKKIYGAYGSNINLQQMKIRCPYAKVVGVGALDGYTLTFRRGGYANVEKCDNDSAPILLWEITPMCERALDRYEGYPHFYVKDTVKVKIEDEIYDTIIYVMTDEYTKQYQLPMEYYLDTILEGYIANGMDTDYVLNKYENHMEMLKK